MATKVVGVWKETASGAKQERAERKKVLALAQARKVDVILLTELIRWGRSARFVARSLPYLNFRFVCAPLLQLGETAVDFPSMQAPASFSLTMAKEQIQEMINHAHGAAGE